MYKDVSLYQHISKMNSISISASLEKKKMTFADSRRSGKIVGGNPAIFLLDKPSYESQNPKDIRTQSKVKRLVIKQKKSSLYL
ncbi:MAG: hypothetical protein ACP5MW_04960 [Thermoplasmata archaeon]